jgi:ATP-dependent DNA helicase RecG
MNLLSSITELPKITKPLIAALKKLGILTCQDLLLYFPYRYLDFTKLVSIKEIKAGENISLKVKIKSISSRFSFRGRLSLAEAVVSDNTGSLKVVWFNQPYLAKSLKKDDEIFLAGMAEYYNFGLQLTNPIYEKVSDFPLHTARLVPLYHLNKNIYLKTFRNLVSVVLPLAKEVKNILPKDILKNQNLLNIQNTIEYSHFPKSEEDLNSAKKRLAFEEIFLNQLSARQYKLKLDQKESFVVPFDQKLVQNFVASLPFILTADQKKAAWEILKDIQKNTPMNRLLEGDVGSGKTLVAFIAALQTVSQGFQAALLAPTEILAKQHFETAKKFLFHKTHNCEFCEIGLLTNNYSILGKKEIAKPKLQKLISEGIPGLFIGTHALLQKKVNFKNLALVIIDEQHRFGVKQRSHLIKSSGRVPHLLSLSATPIPRTLQLAFHGELDISRIQAKPVGRKPIITKFVSQENRKLAYDFIRKQIQTGRQIFVITPLIEESEKLQTKSAIAERENIQKIFPEFSVGLLHGKLKSNEKEKVMESFLENKVQILVSTSVVEVGVDVPNASVMAIEGAERFGLSQLHQFRGRVGRSEHQSCCFVFTDKDDENIKKRLNVFCNTFDGFKLAEEDLNIRGFGEIYGQEQSGWNFKYFNPAYTSLIPEARQEALKILKDDLELEHYPLLRDIIKDKIIHFE